MFGVGSVGLLGLVAGLVPSLVPPGSIVVSADAFDVIPAGNDTTGNGTLANPYATLAKALAVVPEGGVIMLNGNPSAPSNYVAATLYSITKGMTIDAIFKYGAYCKGTGAQTRVFNVAPTAGQTVRFGKIVIDAATTIANCILLTDQTTKYRVELRETACTGWTTQGVSSSASAVTTKVDLYIDGALLLGTTNRSGVYCKGLIEGAFTIVRTQITMNGQNLGGHGGVIVWAKAAGCSVEISQCIIYLTVDDSVSNSTTYGVQVQNIPGVKVMNNALYVEGNHIAGSKPGEVIQIGATGAAPLDSSGAIVRGNTISHKVNGGMAIEIGEDNQDTGSRGFCNGALVENNNIICDDFSLAGATHGIFNGSGANSIIRRNQVINAGISFGDKEGDGCQCYDNVFVDGNGSMLRLKGSKNGIYVHNTFVRTKGSNFNMVLVSSNQTNGHVGANSKVSGNIFYSQVATNFVSAEATEGAVFDHNDYYSTAALGAAAWSISGTNYATLAAWKAAAEASAIAVDPQFNDIVNGDFDVNTAATGLDIVPVNAGVLMDFLNRPFASPASAGAYQRQ